MDPITLTLDEDRFDRFRRIAWWDQARLAAAKIVVVGAGALGNEIIKNLALLGVGKLLVIDSDRIEHSNLSRSVLYRRADEGRPKADVAAAAARGIYPDLQAHAIDGDVVNGVGLGVFRWADLAMGGLDNREARLAINRACFRLGKPWVDGGIQEIDGYARVFEPSPDAPCYECTLGERDWQLIRHRRSCNGLSRDEMLGGRTPTTPTISSIIAGVQCQEGLKLLHGLPTISGHGWTFAGLSADAFSVAYQRKPDCLSHDPLASVVELDATSDDLTAADLLEEARRLAASQNAVVDLGRDYVDRLTCRSCKTDSPCFRPLGSLKFDDLACPACGTPRDPLTFNTLRGDEPFLHRTLADLGLPRFEIVTARSATAEVGIEITGDAPHALGALAEGGLAWE